MPQRQQVPYQERDSCFATGTLPNTKLLFGLVSCYQSPHLVSQPLCLEVAFQTSARGNGAPKAWLFYEFRTPYLSTLTLQQSEKEK